MLFRDGENGHNIILHITCGRETLDVETRSFVYVKAESTELILEWAE